MHVDHQLLSISYEMMYDKLTGGKVRSFARGLMPLVLHVRPLVGDGTPEVKHLFSLHCLHFIKRIQNKSG